MSTRDRTMTAAVLMVQGTASHVGKSTLVTALCRVFRQDGIRVAPFKAQNMALNSFVAAEGGEIGRAQAVQAEAAGIDPSIDMNPILLKPEGDARAQVVVNGISTGSHGAAEYQRTKLTLWPIVVAALERLRTRFDLVVVEGAGSPAEINLRSADLANMRVALHARAPVVLVGDIDRGGVFASLLGTLELLAPEERALVHGFVINKFRGDASILAPGLDLLHTRTGIPFLGVLPFLPKLDLPEEDSLGLPTGRSADDTAASDGRLDVAVVRLPRIANFDDFAALAAEPSVRLRYVERPRDVGAPDLLILPGTKTTVSDLQWLLDTGLGRTIHALAGGSSPTPLLGICGGFQMLGRRIIDPDASESSQVDTPALGLIPIETTFSAIKETRRIQGMVLESDGPFAGAAGTLFDAYEIHMGRTSVGGNVRPLFAIGEHSDDGTDGLDGFATADGMVAGTYLHGLFENDAIRTALIRWLLDRRGIHETPGPARLDREQQYDALAETVRRCLDVDRLRTACGL